MSGNRALSVMRGWARRGVLSTWSLESELQFGCSQSPKYNEVDKNIYCKLQSRVTRGKPIVHSRTRKRRDPIHLGLVNIMMDKTHIVCVLFRPASPLDCNYADHPLPMAGVLCLVSLMAEGHTLPSSCCGLARTNVRRHDMRVNL